MGSTPAPGRALLRGPEDWLSQARMQRKLLDMSDEVIESTRNSRVVDAVKLGQRKHRRRQERFLVEGLQLIGMGLEQRQQRGARPLEAFVCREQLRGEAGLRLLRGVEEAGVTPHEVTPLVMERLAEREEPQGLVVTFALMEEGEVPAPPESSSGLVFVLDRLQDPGNLGTLIRTADAVGAAAVVLLEPSVDAFDPKTVGASMGSIFSVPLVRVEDTEELGTALAGWSIVGADSRQGDVAWEGDALDGSVALALGNEARGLSDDLRALVTRWVRLPVTGAAESLNVAVAGGVLAYEWRRRVSTETGEN